MKRVHIVGLGPRSGTTLMMELLANCFDFDAYANHEMSVLEVPSVAVRKFCSKKPTELKIAARLLPREPDLWVICMVRDPRDVIVSKHLKSPDAYWSNLSIWNQNFHYFNRYHAASRVVSIRYEDLVQDPDAVQDYLESQIAFLNRIHRFSRFHEIASPVDKSVEALSGVRKISPRSIGNWRHHLPRVKAQIREHGSITPALVRLGYESGPDWEAVLTDVLADNGSSVFSERRFCRSLRWRRLIEHLRRRLRASLGVPRKKRVVVKGSLTGS